MNVIDLAKVFKALSHPKRLELYLKIAQQDETDFDAGSECCLVNSMIHLLKLGAPAISHHIKELENAELISTERRGKYLYASAQVEVLEQVEHFFTKHINLKK